MSEAPVAAVFTPAKRVRSFEDIVHQFREAMVSGHLKVGDRLSSERQLCQAFGVSRPTLREALRTLEAEGLVVVKVGSGGGVFVSEPDQQRIGSAIEAVIKFGKGTARDLAEVRVAFESENAWWAAKRADNNDVRELHRIVDSFAREVENDADWTVLAELDLQFHEAVARASKNQVRVAIMLGIHWALYRASASLRPYATLDVRREIVQELQSIGSAIRDHRPPLARKRMDAHVRRFSQLELMVEEQQKGDG